MHKYKPRVHIIQHNPRVDLTQIQSLPAEGVHSFSFPETEFTTVTAYQNQQVKTFSYPRTVKYFATYFVDLRKYWILWVRIGFLDQVCVHKEAQLSLLLYQKEKKHKETIHIKKGRCLGVSLHF